MRGGNAPMLKHGPNTANAEMAMNGHTRGAQVPQWSPTVARRGEASC